MHRLSVGALPRVRSIETMAPRTKGARHVVLDEDGSRARLVFTARGHLMAEPVGAGDDGFVQMLSEGTVDAVWGPVGACHGAIVGLRIDARAVPTIPRRVDMLDGPSVRAHTFGVAAQAPVAVALDVGSGDVHAFDLERATSRVVTTLRTRQAIEMAGPVALTPDGARAYLTIGTSAHEDMWLTEVNLQSGNALAVHAPVTRGSVTGTLWGKRRVIVEQLLGDEPRMRVLVDGRVLIVRDGFHPLAPPVALSDAHLLLLAVPKPDPITKGGDAQLCLLDNQGTLVALAPATGTRIRLVDRTAFIEDGHAITRVQFEG